MVCYFDLVDSKFTEASGHLTTMGQMIIHPRHRPGFSPHLAAQLSCGNTSVVHIWHEAFNAALNAFLSATRSVPDIISNRFGYDQPKKNQWLLNLSQDEQDRRQLFQKRFKQQFEPFLELPLNAERNETHHRSGVAHWEVVVEGDWGTYVGGPLRPLPQFESRLPNPGADPPLGWMEGACTRELQVSWKDFWWVFPQDGTPPLRLSLFGECRNFLGRAQGLVEHGRKLFKEIHEAQSFTLPPW